MASMTAISDLDDMLNDLGLEEAQLQNSLMEAANINNRRASVIGNDAPADASAGSAVSRPSTRANRNRHSNVFSTSAPLGVEMSGSTENADASKRASVQINNPNASLSDMPEAAPAVGGSRASTMLDPDHLTLPDFKQPRSSVSYSRMTV